MSATRQVSDPNSYSWSTAEFDQEVGRIMQSGRPETAHAGRGRTMDFFHGRNSPISKLRNQSVLHGLTIALAGLAVMTIAFGISVAVKSDNYNVTGDSLRIRGLLMGGDQEDKNTTIVSCEDYETFRTCLTVLPIPCEKTCHSKPSSGLCPCRNECVCRDGQARSGKRCVREEDCGLVDSFYTEDWVDGAAIWCGLLLLLSSLLGAFTTWHTSYRPSLLTAFFFINSFTVCLSMLVLFSVWLGFRNGNWSQMRRFEGEEAVKIQLALFSLIFIFAFAYMLAASVVSVLICYHWNMYGPLEPPVAQMSANGNAWHSLVSTTNAVQPRPINNNNNNNSNILANGQPYPRLQMANGNGPELLSVASIANQRDDISRLSDAVGGSFQFQHDSNNTNNDNDKNNNDNYNNKKKHENVLGKNGDFKNGDVGNNVPDVKLSLHDVAMKSNPNLQNVQHCSDSESE